MASYIQKIEADVGIIEGAKVKDIPAHVARWAEAPVADYALSFEIGWRKQIMLNPGGRSNIILNARIRRLQCAICNFQFAVIVGKPAFEMQHSLSGVHADAKFLAGNRLHHEIVRTSIH